MRDAGGPASLIGVEELAGALGAVTVLDVRYRMGGPPGRQEYEAGHVPGASYVDLDADLAGPPGPRGRHPLPEADVFQAAMRAAGVRNGRPVVVYDDWSSHAAARCWWLLRFFGHSDVRVLDGGWSAWVAAGRPTESGLGGVREAGDLRVVPGGMPVVDVDSVRTAAVVVDARAAERYRGEVEPIDPVAGHIPGAVNVPTQRNLAADGRLLPAEELRALYASVGVRDPDGRASDAGEAPAVAAYCGSGVTAALDVLAMDVAGIRAALYPGSWSEWVADPSRPVETSDPARLDI